MKHIVMVLALLAIFCGVLFPDEWGILLLILGAALLTWSLHRLRAWPLAPRPVLARVPRLRR
jgi:uncharacterized protein involved in response to NO